MNLLRIVFCLLLLFSVVARAEVQFITSSSENSRAWQESVKSLFGEFNQLAPTPKSVPQALNVFFESGIDATYRPTFSYLNANMQFKTIDGVLSVGELRRHVVAHEYGHAIFDYYMRSESKFWQYYVIKRRVTYETLEEAVGKYEDTIAALLRDQAKYQQKLAENPNDSFAKKVLANISNSLEHNRPHLPMVKYGKKIEIEYGADKLQSFQHFDFLEPYQELFADAFAAVYFDDWSVMKNSILKEGLIRPDFHELYVMPPAESDLKAIRLMAEQRDFPASVDLNYPFKDWHASSAYWQFLPARAYFRQRVEETGSPKKVLGELLVAIKLIYADAAVNGSKPVSLKEKNRCLIHAMKTGSLCNAQ